MPINSSSFLPRRINGLARMLMTGFFLGSHLKEVFSLLSVAADGDISLTAKSESTFEGIAKWLPFSAAEGAAHLLPFLCFGDFEDCGEEGVSPPLGGGTWINGPRDVVGTVVPEA